MKQFQCQNIMSDDIMTEQLPFPIDQWKESFVEMPVYFHVIFMNETVFAWVGPQSGELKNLHASFPTQQSWGTLPPSTTVYGSSVSDNPGQGIAARLTKRTGNAIFVSYNMPSNIPHLQEYVEKKLRERIMAVRGVPAQ